MKKLLLIMIVMLIAFPVLAESNARTYIETNADKMFVTGKTDYIIQGKMVSSPTDVYNELELVSYHVEDDNQSVILKGKLGEEWVTNVSKVITTYTHLDGTPLTSEDFINNKDEYIELRTIPTGDANFALHVPVDTVLMVETAWGDILYTNASEVPHGDGDYLVCNNVDGKPDLSDVWVVNGAQFVVNYDMSNAR